MTGEQKIGGVTFAEGMVKSYTEGPREKYSKSVTYSVWLNDGTYIEYQAQKNASVSQKNGETIFSGLYSSTICGTKNNDHYTLEGCSHSIVNAHEYKRGFNLLWKPADEDIITVKDKVNSDGTVVESENNLFIVNQNDKIKLQDDQQTTTIAEMRGEYYQGKIRRSNFMLDYMPIR